ncbi:MAG: AMP-binding protein [Chloroflexi bacterium]|nr:AMP-binding protein [Chloroflexota bacterium]
MTERRYYNRKIETMSREELRDFQWKILKEQIEYTYAHSGLCQRQFKAAGITPADIQSLEDFTNKVPFTTKKDMVEDQEASPPYGTRLSAPKKDIFMTWLTSGTSGKGQEVHVVTRQDLRFFMDGPATMYVWAGWTPEDKVMLPLPIGITSAAPVHVGALWLVGCEVFNLGMYDTKTKIEYMRRFNMSAFFSTTAYLETLTTDAETMGLDPARDFNVRKILIAIQPYPVSFIEKMEKKWNAKIYDYYASTQFAMGSTCENGAVNNGQRGFYHLYDFVTYHEVIDPDTSRHVAPGEVGEMVVTPLYRRAGPYLRFRMADKVRYFPHTACNCRRPFTLLEAGTVARYDDMMKVKGINIWPETIDEIIFTKDEAFEYRGRLYISADGREKAEVVLEFKPGVGAEVKQRLMKVIGDEIRDKTGIGFDIKETAEPIPHSVFKIRRWTDDRVKGLGA